MIDTVLFDLDGTLLPMDQDLFVQTYLRLLSAKMAPYGYEPQKLIQAVWAGTGAMVKNDGSVTNEAAFWEEFQQIFGPDVARDMPLFEEFYASDFAGVRTVCGFDPAAAEVVSALKDRGATVVLATNPLFPATATRQRVRWAGLDPADFQRITTYENSSFCKPNPDYYREILEKIGKEPDRCLMVGNDAAEDMVAREVGMQVFLLTPCLINRKDEDIRAYPQGGFRELKEFLTQQNIL